MFKDDGVKIGNSILIIEYGSTSSSSSFKFRNPFGIIAIETWFLDEEQRFESSKPFKYFSV